MCVVILIGGVVQAQISPQLLAASKSPREASATADAGEDAADSATPATPQPFTEHVLNWLGHFHVILVHFPIALILAAAMAEILSLLLQRPALTSTARFCVFAGTAGAVAATVLGWFAASEESASETLTLHRWTGTGAAGLAVILAIVALADARRARRGWLFRALLLASAMIVGIAAHFGGQLVHGTGFLDW
jgi:uncharacterized membrane protein